MRPGEGVTVPHRVFHSLLLLASRYRFRCAAVAVNPNDLDAACYPDVAVEAHRHRLEEDVNPLVQQLPLILIQIVLRGNIANVVRATILSRPLTLLAGKQVLLP